MPEHYTKLWNLSSGKCDLNKSYINYFVFMIFLTQENIAVAKLIFLFFSLPEIKKILAY